MTVLWAWRLSLAIVALATPFGSPDQPQAPPSIQSYVCYRAPAPIVVDGDLTDDGWQHAAWTESFVDILGDDAPAPHLRTRVKMLWDDEYLYVAAELEEPHVWATLTERDAVIYRDDDFEVFLDPDGDTHEYYELEINALGAWWDLFLVRPYRDGGPAIDAWDVRDLRAAVRVDGTINDPSDTDRGWTVELAIPWDPITEAAREQRAPRGGEQWRINFSRVDWDVGVVDGAYRKRMNPATSRPLPERNWVWSPQGAINMHMPEMWGFVQFSDRTVGTGRETFVEDVDEPVRQALRAVYHMQRAYLKANGEFATTVTALDVRPVDPSMRATLELLATPVQYEATLPSRTRGATWHIRQDGKVWRTP